MTPERQIEAMARIDGERKVYYDDEDGCWCAWNQYDTIDANYLTDYNAVHRVLRGLSENQHAYFSLKMASMMGEIDKYSHEADCAQMTEAILRACGAWVEAEKES